MSKTRLALLTCSMARDLDLFALLARSVDAHVPEDIPHRVVVPKSDIAAFRAFRTLRREIIAQEDVMPFQTIKIPNLPPSLSRFARAGQRIAVMIQFSHGLAEACDGWKIPCNGD